MNRPRRPMVASRIVRQPVARVFAVLADLENHWRLSPAFAVEAVEQEPGGRQVGARVRVRGPLGLRRRVATQLSTVIPVRRIAGQACAGRSQARISWELEQVTPDRTKVQLSVRLVRAGMLDRLLFALGARRWLVRRFDEALRQLDRIAAHESAKVAAEAPLLGVG